jgi:hypothetical protein
MQISGHNENAKNGKRNNLHFDVKLAPDSFDAKLIICIAFPDEPGECSTQVTGFKTWPRIGRVTYFWKSIGQC